MRYSQDISRYKLITAEEERRLGALSFAGDLDARNKLVEANLRLVIKIASEFRTYGYEMEDLVSEGNIGLIKAAEKYNPEKYDNRFSVYAGIWIKQAIRNGIAQYSGIVKIPTNAHEQIRKVIAIRIQLRHKLNREPTIDELSVAAELSTKVIKNVINYSVSKKSTSLDAKSVNKKKEETDLSLIDSLMGADKTDHVEEIFKRDEIKQLNECIDLLDDRTKHIILHLYGLRGKRRKTLTELGKDIGRVRERVRQISQDGYDKIKKELVSV